MSTVTQHATGMFCWTQLGTTDPEGARKFYSGLFGWTGEETRVGGGPSFTLLKLHGQAVGMLYGLHPKEREEGIGPNWLSYVAVESADKISAAVKSSGGKVRMDPFDIEDNGRMAVCQDPTGAVFALWQAGTKPGAGIVNETGSMCWNELITNDSSKAGAFYRQVFGWQEEPVPMPRGGTYAIFKKDGKQAGGMMTATPEMHLTHPYWLVYFAVDNCDKSVARANELGGKTKLPPTDIPNIGRFAVLTDPAGAYFAIIAMAKRA